MPTKKYKIKKPATNKKHYRHPKGSTCSLCGSNLRSTSTASRHLINLEEKSKLKIQIRGCVNIDCLNYKEQLKPVAYLNQIVPESAYGIDVYGLIGHLRLSQRQTIPEIHQYLLSTYSHLEFGERHVENMMNYLSLSIEQSGKNATYLQQYFSARNQSNLVLSIDGIEPEKGHSILYIVREVLSGKILFAHYSTYSDADSLSKEILLPLQEVLQTANLSVAGWIADKELALGKAVQEVYKDVPFQHCQSHFLAAMKKPLTSADTELGKTIKKTLVR